ncbi:MAG: ergothioneine biosynthesis protein EgtB [Pseudomonadota bacterium]
MDAAYGRVRAQSLALCEPLEIEDYGVQPMAEASPPKWHLAHTTWFFETFLLKPLLDGYVEFHERFEYLFNSYYNGVGRPYPRPERGNLSRPIVAEVIAYRSHVDLAMEKLLAQGDEEVERRTVLGLHHEQQHQELMLTDLKVNFGRNPLAPVYRSARQLSAVDADTLRDSAPGAARPLSLVSYDSGLREIGLDPADSAFAFDNESPRHRVYLEPFELADRVVTCDEYLEFMADSGYNTPSLWLSDGWAWVQQESIAAPLYWRQRDGEWWEYRLHGETEVRGATPVTHLSGYEADAYARWAGYRLPTEAEWEVAAAEEELHGNFVESGSYHPRPPGEGSRQLFGDVWEWTSSAYGPYPGYAPLPGTLGEYNGKFLSNQLVLRGGSCATPADHIRISYRNFFYPQDRWQFTGLRLARDAT